MDAPLLIWLTSSSLTQESKINSRVIPLIYNFHTPIVVILLILVYPTLIIVTTKIRKG